MEPTKFAKGLDLEYEGKRIQRKAPECSYISCEEKTGVGFGWGGEKQALGRSQEFGFVYVMSEMPPKWICYGCSCLEMSGVQERD